MRVIRDGNWSSVCELTVNMEWELLTAHEYTDGDNKYVVPTDSMKNSIYALAAKNEVCISPQ